MNYNLNYNLNMNGNKQISLRYNLKKETKAEDKDKDKDEDYGRDIIGKSLLKSPLYEKKHDTHWILDFMREENQYKFDTISI